MSKRESVLAAIATLLTDLADGRVYRSRREQLPALPCIVIEPESESTIEGPIGRINATLTVAISVFYQGEIPDQAGDTLISTVVQRIESSPGLGFSDGSVQAQIGTELSFDIENFDTGRAVIRARVDYVRPVGGA